MRVVFWGTYDLSKPRTRILLRGLRENGVEVLECHRDVWRSVEDKSGIMSLRDRLHTAARWFAAYPGLIIRYLRLPRHDAVLVGYLGHLDVLVLWPLARLRRVPIVWDAFLSLYDTVVEDRALVTRRHPLALLLYALEWLACRAADRVVLDTRAHADYFVARYKISAERTAAVFVGVEPEMFPPRPAMPPQPAGAPTRVLFYGQFIPLHGIETIVKAAQMTEAEPIEWVLIGRGQEEDKVRRMISDAHPKNLTWIPWVPYVELKDQIAKADICLGIFGDTAKAARVIPNKVFQILASGASLVTRDSPAIRELLEDDIPGIRLVPPADSDALSRAVRKLRLEGQKAARSALHEEVAAKLRPSAVGAAVASIISQAACKTGQFEIHEIKKL